VKNDLRVPPFKSLKVIGTDTDRSATYDFLLKFHGNNWPISYCFRDKRLFQSKIANFPHPVYLTPPMNEFPLELAISTRGKKIEWWGYRAKKEVWRFFSRLDTIHVRDRERRTDRHRPTPDSKDHAYA